MAFEKGNKYRFKNKISAEQHETVKKMVMDTVNYDIITKKIESWGVSELTAYREIHKAAKELLLDKQ